MIDPGLGDVHVQRSADVAGAVSHLPAVATHDWCDEAARQLIGIRPGSLVAVSVAVLGQQGEISLIEMSGCSDRERSFVMRPEHAVSLGWWLPQGGAHRGVRTGLLAQLPTARVWPSTDPGMRWARYSMRDLVVGLAPLAGQPGRHLVVELGVTLDDGPLDRGDAAVLRAILPMLAHRATVAFGTEPSGSATRLTVREQQVLEQLALGKSVKVIAEELGRSAHTVHDHVKSLHRKLNASSRGELIARALGHIEVCVRDRPAEVHVASQSAQKFLSSDVSTSRAIAS